MTKTAPPSVLILGAHSDVAHPIARLYASDGYRVLLAARNVQRLEACAADLRIRYRIDAEIYEFDALATQTHKTFVEQLPVLPDVLITLVGLMTPETEAQSSFQAAELVIRSNYLGLVSIVTEIAGRMEQRGSGTIIGVSSVAGARGRATNYIYGSAKAGYSTFLSGLRNRLFRKGVIVITVKPGFVRTRMTHGMHLPAKLTAQPDELARAIYKAHQKKRMIVYYKSVWRPIMLIVRLLPEVIFARTNI